MTMSKKYEQQQRDAYHVVEGHLMAEQLSEIFQMQFGGSQPWGITSRPLGTNSDGEQMDEVFVACYFEPLVMHLRLTWGKDGDLKLEAFPIRGADHGTDSVRVWPGEPGGPWGRENRGREVCVTSGDLWVIKWTGLSRQLLTGFHEQNFDLYVHGSGRDMILF